MLCRRWVAKLVFSCSREVSRFNAGDAQYWMKDLLAGVVTGGWITFASGSEA